MVRVSLPKDEIITIFLHLKSFSKQRCLPEGRRIHARLADCGYDRLNCFAKVLIQMYGRCGRVEDAESVFTSVYNPDALTSCAMLAAYACNGCVKQGEHLFDRINIKGGIHWRGMVKLYSTNGLLDKAIYTFEIASIKDHRLWNVMLATFAGSGHYENALDLLEKMPFRSDKTFDCLVTAFLKAGDVTGASAVFDRMWLPSTRKWNVMITAYAQAGQDLSSSLTMFRKMVLAGQPPSEGTFISIFNICDRPDALSYGRFAEFCARELHLVGVKLTDELIKMYGKCGNLLDAKRVFFTSRRVKTGSWNSLIAAYVGNGEHSMANETFRDMNHEGFMPDGDTFVVHLRSRCLADTKKGVFDCFKSMHEYILTPNWDHYCEIVEFFVNRKELAEAEDLLLNVPSQPEPAGWMVLLKGCKAHRDVKRGIRAARKVIEMDPENVAVYSLLQGLSENKEYQEQVKWIIKHLTCNS